MTQESTTPAGQNFEELERELSSAQSRKEANADVSRRDFLKVSAAAGAGLVIGFFLPGCGGPPRPAPAATPTATPAATPTAMPAATPEPAAWFEPNAFLKIDNNGVVTILAPRPDIGQGARTALPMMVAEDLEADWTTIRIEQAPADRIYGDQFVGGSDSTSGSYMRLRQAGAVAREMLIAAAAQTWGVEKESCYAEQGTVVHAPTGQRLAYGQLVEMAASMPVPTGREVTLKDPQDFRIIGTPVGRLDNHPIVDGSAVYGMDVRLPGMLYAVIARCPVFGGKLAGFEPSESMAVEGVRHVMEVNRGVAIVADSTWAAIQGREALQVNWEQGNYGGLSSADIRESLAEGHSGASDDPHVLEAVYDIPYLAHAPMEPMNCTADVRADRCQVWAPTQRPQQAKNRAQAIAGLPEEAVTLHVTMIGGGFGRRLEVDYVDEAVEISKAVGAPVQVVWTREDDIRHDYYHPLSVNQARVNLEDPSRPTLYSRPAGGVITTGAWRAVTNIPEAFAHECLMDELAGELGQDPYQYRLELLPGRHRAVLELAAARADWGTPLPEGWGRGLAIHATWGVSPTAIVAEVSVAAGGFVRVRRVVCAVDCGLVVNPDLVKAQMEGGIVFGLTAALKKGITIENGRVQQSNFHDCELLRMDEMPLIEVHIAPSDIHLPGGVGEMSTPPTIPAVANAVFAATGVRVRRIPILPEDILAAR